jgi:hypothetical protein
MPIFSRRLLQRILDENRHFLAEGVVEEHVRKLNGLNQDSIATEWEVLILNVLSRIGKVEYERQFSGPSRPDVFFQSRIVQEFVADITTLSDADYEQNNPTEYFYRCIREYFQQNDMLASGLNIHIESNKRGTYGNRKIKLCLPHKSEVRSFVKKHFKAIIKTIKSEPKKAFQTVISEGDAHVQVSYDPNDSFFSARHLSYNVPYSLRRNPVYNRLRQKSAQLKQCGFEGIAGVFLCDGDCNALRTATLGPEGYAKQRIIGEAFRQNSTLSFAVTLAVEEKRLPLQLQVQRSIRAEFYANSQAKYPAGKQFWEELSNICKFFPVPQVTPANALRNIKIDRHKGVSFLGGGSMDGDEITIPSRTLTEILAGTLNYNAATKGEKGPLGSIAWMKDFFRRQVLAGKTIAAISVVNCPDEDDDWIKIKYGPTDPAISKFK